MKKLFLLVLPLFAACSSNNKTNEGGDAPDDYTQMGAEVVEPTIAVNTSTEDFTTTPAAEETTTYIMEPGVVYYTTKDMPEENGIRNRLTLELTSYKDGSFSGQLIATSINTWRDDEETNLNFPIEGEWDETSKHDKRVMIVEFEVEKLEQEYIVYIDEDLKVYWNSLNATPEQLYKK